MKFSLHQNFVVLGYRNFAAFKFHVFALYHGRRYIGNDE